MDTSAHEEPWGAEDNGDDEDAGEDVLLISAIEIVLHPRSEPAAIAARHRLLFRFLASTSVRNKETFWDPNINQNMAKFKKKINNFIKFPKKKFFFFANT